MRILIVTNHFYPEEFRINDIARSLRDKGHEITIITGMPDYPLGRIFPGYGIFSRRVEIMDGIIIQRVPVFPRGNGPLYKLLLNYISFALFSCLLAPWYGRRKHDVIFVFETSPITVCLPAIIIKKMKSIPIILWVLDLWPESMSATGYVRSPGVLKTVGRLVQFIYSQCEQILISSKGFIKNTQAMGVESQRVEYFPNWVEPAYNLRLEEDCENRIPVLPKGFIILFAGNVGVVQSFNTVLNAAIALQDNPGVHWVILGDGRMHPWLKEQVQIMGLEENFHLLGRFPMETMPLFFAQADALLVSLKKDPIFTLTVPGKVQSYMASGKPLIASLDGEGAALIQEAACGLTCPAESVSALTIAVKQMLLMSPEERQEMGQRGKVYCQEHFGKEKLLNKLEGVLNSTKHR